jgi:hypothetical protein
MLSAMPGAKVNPHEVPVPAESLDELESIAAGPPASQAPLEMRTTAQSASRPSTDARQ